MNERLAPTDELDDTCSTLLADNAELLSGWQYRVRGEKNGNIAVLWTHPLSAGLAVEFARDTSPNVYAPVIERSVVRSHEVAAIGALPQPAQRSLELAVAIRQLSLAFNWPATQIAGMAGLLFEHGAISHDEAAWLAGYCAHDAPMTPRPFQ